MTCPINCSIGYNATSTYFTVKIGGGIVEEKNEVNTSLIRVDIDANIAELRHPGLEAPPRPIEYIWICCLLREITNDAVVCWMMSIGCMLQRVLYYIVLVKSLQSINKPIFIVSPSNDDLH